VLIVRVFPALPDKQRFVGEVATSVEKERSSRNHADVLPDRSSRALSSSTSG
jgi:hypothetical protein